MGDTKSFKVPVYSSVFFLEDSGSVPSTYDGEQHPGGVGYIHPPEAMNPVLQKLLAGLLDKCIFMSPHKVLIRLRLVLCEGHSMDHIAEFSLLFDTF